MLDDVGWRAAFLWMAHTDRYQPRGGPLLLALGAMLVATTFLLALSEAQARLTIPLRPIASAFAAVALMAALDLAVRLRTTAQARTGVAATT